MSPIMKKLPMQGDTIITMVDNGERHLRAMIVHEVLSGSKILAIAMSGPPDFKELEYADSLDVGFWTWPENVR